MLLICYEYWNVLLVILLLSLGLVFYPRTYLFVPTVMIAVIVLLVVIISVIPVVIISVIPVVIISVIPIVSVPAPIAPVVVLLGPPHDQDHLGSAPLWTQMSSLFLVE